MKLKTTVILVFFASINIAYTQSSFSFYGTAVKPGTKQHFKIPIADKEHETFIPITVFHGMEKGPVLGITAGVHGYEYPPILAGQRLIKSINLNALKGTVILVQIANLESFSGRSPYENPFDGKNLNRVFPGDANGSITEKIADFITNHVIAKSDFFMDMHAGDAPEDLMPYSAYYSNSAMPEVSKQGRDMAQSLLFEHIIIFNTDKSAYVKKESPSLYCSAEAFKRGIPSVDIECGRLGKTEKDAILKIENGVLNMLQHLNMYTADTKVKKNNSYLFVSNRVYQKSNHDGIFYPSKKSGDYVKKGMKIGVVTDYFGNTLENIYAESNGLVLIIIGTPPINKDETIAVIASIDEQ